MDFSIAKLPQDISRHLFLRQSVVLNSNLKLASLGGENFFIIDHDLSTTPRRQRAVWHDFLTNFCDVFRLFHRFLTNTISRGTIEFKTTTYSSLPGGLCTVRIATTLTLKLRIREWLAMGFPFVVGESALSAASAFQQLNKVKYLTSP